MSIITLVIVLAIVGFLLWLIQVKVPMDATVKMIIHAVVIIALVIWLLKVFGVWGDINVPRV